MEKIAVLITILSVFTAGYFYGHEFGLEKGARLERKRSSLTLNGRVVEVSDLVNGR